MYVSTMTWWLTMRPSWLSGDGVCLRMVNWLCVVVCFKVLVGPLAPMGALGGLMRAWHVARKCPSAEPPSFVPKTAEIDSVFGTGRRHCLLGSACSGQAAMTWCAVWRGSSHWRGCESNDRRRKRTAYSPVKEWPVRSLKPVVAIGRGYSKIPSMNEGRVPSGGFVRARYAGWRRGASIQRSHHSAMASSRAVLGSKAFDGGGGGRLGLGEQLPLRWP